MISDLGFSREDEIVYEALLALRNATAVALVDRCGLPPDAVTGSLTALVAGGLVDGPRSGDDCSVYGVLSPDLAFESLIAQREAVLKRVRLEAAALTDRLRDRAAGESADDVVAVIRGAGDHRDCFHELQMSARKQLRFFDKPPYVVGQGNDAEPLLLRRGLAYRTVYASEICDIPGKLEGIREAISAGEQCRLSPEVPVKLVIADESTALLALDLTEQPTSALVRRSPLLSALCALFELVWTQSLHIPGARPAGAADSLADERNVLLQLLAAGQSDQAIARRLGLSPRTVQRRVSRLMQDLGVVSRFQLGMRAVAIGDRAVWGDPDGASVRTHPPGERP
ncbi:helix-turn-helix transcriptional regulator [Streptomyces sp. NPDC051940]|uniref:helix-turn-helix transcriptional regulator n=1 Tax=Streptomyces sp. NPDC051940 TaxID=3155675 RepID=UPI00341463F3